MATKPQKLSPTSLARADRQRIAAEEGARAMADVEREALAVRKNMQRLRALREARDAEAARTGPAPAQSAANTIKRSKRVVR